MSANIFVCQNNSGHIIRHNGFAVKPGYIYGTRYNYDFVARPVILWQEKKMDMKIHFNRGFCDGIDNKWTSGQTDQIVKMIVNAFESHKISLSNWDVNADTKKQERKAKNRDAKEAYRGEKPVRRKHLKVSGRKTRVSPSFGYVAESTRIYGDEIEINGKKRRMSGNVAQYMDGNGSGLRPLDTGCFIGSGRKIKFGKAPQA